MQYQNLKDKNQPAEALAQAGITIEAELVIPLGELATYILKNNKETSDIVTMLEENPAPINRTIEKIIKGVIKENKTGVHIEKIEFDYNDSGNVSHGAAYFRSILEGTEEALREFAGEDKLFIYDWKNH